ncbi:MAG: hypothetical protein ABIS07_12295 [Dokdonella sp.]
MPDENGGPVDHPTPEPHPAEPKEPHVPDIKIKDNSGNLGTTGSPKDGGSD